MSNSLGLHKILEEVEELKMILLPEADTRAREVLAKLSSQQETSRLD